MYKKLTESSIQNKRMYLHKKKEQRRAGSSPCVTELPVLPKDRPLIGVVNIHVVCAAALALIQSNPTQMLILTCREAGFSLFVDVWAIPSILEQQDTFPPHSKEYL